MRAETRVALVRLIDRDEEMPPEGRAAALALVDELQDLLVRVGSISESLVRIAAAADRQR
jgi:hypothetical protein